MYKRQVPIVRETGGLKDSIQDCSLGSGNGFTFSGYDGEQMKNALYRAKEVYYKKDEWESLVKYGMSCDLSWKNSAAQYIEMYEDVLRF